MQPEQDLADAGLRPQTCVALGGIGRFGFYAQDPRGQQRLWQGWGLGPGAAELEEGLGWWLRPRTFMAGRDVGRAQVQAQDLGSQRGHWGFGRLRTCVAGRGHVVGRAQAWGLRPRTLAASPEPKWAGETPAIFPLIP